MEIYQSRWRKWLMTRLDRAGSKSAEVIQKAMNKCLPASCNGGGFSFTDGYWSETLGRYRAFVTDLKGTVVVSAGEPEDFVSELKR